MAALDKGLADLYAGVDALPDTVKAGLAKDPKYLGLLKILDTVIAQIGTPQDPPGSPTVIGALKYQNVLMAGATTNVGIAKTGLTAAKNAAPLGCAGATPDAACTAINAGIDAIDKTNADATLGGALQQIATTSGISTKIQGQLYNTAGGQAGCTTDPPVDCGASQALQVVRAGIPVLIDGILAQVEGALLPKIGVPKAGCDPKSSLRCASAALTAGAAALATGTSTLNSKVPALSSGVNSLAAGANQLADGSAQVADGTEQLAEGTETLDGKVPALASGVNQLAAGGEQLAAGNEQLATGLTSAADGSGQLADGLAQAEPGGAQIEEGA
jgi:putative membrane protein